MARLFVRHDVADFGAWKSGYDADANAALRAELGVTADGIYQAVDDAGDVTVWHDFDSVETAQSFIADPRLASAMADLGVIGEPQIWITTEA